MENHNHNKTKKEILEHYKEEAQETLLKIEITTKYIQQRYAEDSKQHLLEELGKLSANQKENEQWLKFIEEQLAEEK